eukprot:Phypoly_transcript_10133.p1 GENE.Phypoly_transcript_10133~~Phypoly_transcript_10133.p1  ORF type:complete len:446 (-),score=57.94 Phypoly_transcript_10133:2-1198(-)
MAAAQATTPLSTSRLSQNNRPIRALYDLSTGSGDVTNSNERADMKRQIYDEVERYIERLEGGELIDGSRWELLFERRGQVEIKQSSRLLRFARESKILTPHRYYLFLAHLLTLREFVAAQLVLNTMTEDGMRLANWQYLQLISMSCAEYTLFMRLLALMDLNAWDYPIATPRLADLTTKMLQNFASSGRGLNSGTNVGHLMHMVPHMNSRMLEAFATFSDQPNDCAHVHAYITRTGLLPTMKIYQHFAKFLQPTLLPEMYHQMQSRGLIPTPKMYIDLILRFQSEPQSEFVVQLSNDMIPHNFSLPLHTGFSVLDILFQAKQTENAFLLLQKLLEGPFTKDDHKFVIQLLRKFSENFGGTPFEEHFHALVQKIETIPPDQFVPPNTNGKPLLPMDDEW